MSKSDSYSLDAVLESLNEMNMALETELETPMDSTDVTIVGDAAIESELVLEALRDECNNDEEFKNLLEESAYEMALFGIIDDAEVATEATRTIVKMSKQGNFNRIEKRAAIRLAMRAGDQRYTKYKKYRDLWREQRDAIYKVYGPQAKREAKKIIANARRKASGMSTSSNITEKMDSQIAKMSS